ncbi:zf-HC2 domain-containing protein [Nocardia sp. NPDC005366]|uniref:zf-HC2 domain-containing protein n=1 Tax=Nocardia sp. NPDC005366 TaxID=3156878 RepID=UPI0033ACA366
MSELHCDEVVELVTDYLEGAMTEAEAARFLRHLEYCAGCDDYLDQVRTTIRALGRHTSPGLSEAAKQALLEEFRSRST